MCRLFSGLTLASKKYSPSWIGASKMRAIHVIVGMRLEKDKKMFPS